MLRYLYYRTKEKIRIDPEPRDKKILGQSLPRDADRDKYFPKKSIRYIDATEGGGTKVFVVPPQPAPFVDPTPNVKVINIYLSRQREYIPRRLPTSTEFCSCKPLIFSIVSTLYNVTRLRIGRACYKSAISAVSPSQTVTYWSPSCCDENV